MVVDKAHTVERFNRTLKEKIQTRLDAMDLSRDKWTSQLEAVVNKYNNTVHSTIKMSPSDARKEGNKLTASFNIWAQSKKDRVYPELKVGDERAWVSGCFLASSLRAMTACITIHK